MYLTQTTRTLVIPPRPRLSCIHSDCHTTTVTVITATMPPTLFSTQIGFDTHFTGTNTTPRRGARKRKRLHDLVRDLQLRAKPPVRPGFKGRRRTWRLLYFSFLLTTPKTYTPLLLIYKRAWGSPTWKGGFTNTIHENNHRDSLLNSL